MFNEEILLRMGLDSKQVEAGLTSISGKISKFAATAKTALVGVLSGLGLGVSIGQMQRVLELAETIRSRSESWGVSTKFFQDIMNVAKTVPGADRAIEASMKTFIKSLPTGTSIESAFMAMADRLKAIPDPAERARVALEEFGKQGLKILPVMMKGSDGIRELAKEFRTLSEIDISRLEEANHLLEVLKQDFTIVLGEKVGGAYSNLKGRWNNPIFTDKGFARAQLDPDRDPEAEMQRRQKLYEDRLASRSQAAFVTQTAREDFKKFVEDLRLKTSEDPQKLEILNVRLRDAKQALAALKAEPERLEQIKKILTVETDIAEVSKRMGKEKEAAREREKRDLETRRKEEERIAEIRKRASERVQQTGAAVLNEKMRPGKFSIEDLANFDEGYRPAQMAAQRILQLREWAKQNAMAGNTQLADRQLSMADQIFEGLSSRNKYLVDPVAELIKTNQEARDELVKLNSAAAGPGLKMIPTNAE